MRARPLAAPVSSGVAFLLRRRHVPATFMYAALLIVHSWLRWVVLVLALVSLLRAVQGFRGGRDFGASDERVGKLFLMSVDIQLLLGLILYAFLSPVTHGAFADFGAAMKDRVMRFWAVEHSSLMLLAVVVAHVGRVRGKKLGAAAARHKTTLITVGVFLLLVLLAFPWPGLAQARPLLRFGM
jgi:hypothetical protein